MLLTFLALHLATVMALASTLQRLFPTRDELHQAARGLFMPGFLVPVNRDQRVQLTASLKLGAVVATGVVLLVLQARLAQLYAL